MSLMNGVLTFVIFLAGIIVVYIQIIVEEERRQGKHIPLFWEKDFWEGRHPFQKFNKLMKSGRLNKVIKKFLKS